MLGKLNSTCYLVMKVWDIRTKKLKQDLPGHADEVKLWLEGAVQVFLLGFYVIPLPISRSKN